MDLRISSKKMISEISNCGKFALQCHIAPAVHRPISYVMTSKHTLSGPKKYFISPTTPRLQETNKRLAAAHKCLVRHLRLKHNVYDGLVCIMMQSILRSRQLYVRVYGKRSGGLIIGCLVLCRAEVGNLFCSAAGFKMKSFSRTACSKNTNIQR